MHTPNVDAGRLERRVRLVDRETMPGTHGFCSFFPFSAIRGTPLLRLTTLCRNVARMKRSEIRVSKPRTSRISPQSGYIRATLAPFNQTPTGRSRILFAWSRSIRVPRPVSKWTNRFDCDTYDHFFPGGFQRILKALVMPPPAPGMVLPYSS